MREIRYVIALILATALYIYMAQSYKIGINDSVFFISILWILPLSIRFGSFILNTEIKTLENEFNDKNGKYDEMSSKLESEKLQKNYLENKLSELSRLYTITKDMSFGMRFNELGNSLKNFLEENFKCKRSRIILFKSENGNRKIEHIYEIGNKEYQTEISKAFQHIIDLCKECKEPMFFEKKQNNFNFDEEPGLDNILLVPLVARKEVMSIFLVENIDKIDYDKFLILASQVALQVERINLFEDVERLSITDGLTKTYLRRYFLERMEEELMRARQNRFNLAFIMLDLDYFKKCNDNFGHLVGDAVLEDIADILKDNVREIDLVGRYGGEEFCILLPETNKNGAFVVAERIRKTIEKRTIKAYDESVNITMSMGISSFPDDSDKLEQLIEKADKALYEAKRGGRNMICLS